MTLYLTKVKAETAAQNLARTKGLQSYAIHTRWRTQRNPNRQIDAGWVAEVIHQGQHIYA